MILTFEGNNPVASYLQIIENLTPEFAEAAKEIYELDINAHQPLLPKLIYNGHEK